MRRTFRRSSACCLALVLALSVPGGRALAGPDEEYVWKVKEGLDVLDREKIDALSRDVRAATDEELAERGAKLASGRAYAHRNWRKIQAASEVLSVAGRLVELRWAHHAFAMWSIEKERQERVDALHERENAITVARYGEPYYSIFVPKRSRGWEKDPEFAGFRDEEKRIQAWFVDTLTQQKAEAEGGDATTASKLLGEMRTEAMADSDALGRATWAVDKEVARRKGVDLKTPAELAEKADADAKEREEEHARHRMRLVPYRTEYEAATGEVVSAAFQVFKGAPSYLVATHHAATLEGPRFLTIPQAGDFVVPFTFRSAGTHAVSIRAYDAQGESASASITVTVTGAPLPPEPKPPGVGETGPKPPPVADATAPTPGVKPVPISGTFSALIWHANAELADMTAATMRVTPVPITLTIDPSGAITGKARYAMPEAEMRPLVDPAMFGRHWRSSFDLAGTVDWTTGKVHLAISNGLDESGHEKNVEKLGHWRQGSRVEYSGTLDGWTVPGPDSAAWLTRLGAMPGVGAQLKGADLEGLTGLPNPTVNADGTLSFASRGFLGSADFGAKPGPESFRRLSYRSWIDHMGYDGKNARDDDRTAEQQRREAARGGGAWHLRILGDAPPALPPAAPAPTADPRSDMLAFGLWPAKPVTARVGGVVKAQAMAVYRQDVFDAVDRSKAVTWSSDGLEVLGDGSFRATKPGTYLVTAKTGDGPQAMTSTLTVVVKP